jgi:mRNA interferase MazF
VAQFVPHQGDVVWLDFDPQTGHEQKGRRPALVLSPAAYNAKVGMIVCCPISSQEKGYPFEVALAGARGIKGVALADQIKSLDWQARRASRKTKVSMNVVAAVVNKIVLLITPPQQ